MKGNRKEERCGCSVVPTHGAYCLLLRILYGAAATSRKQPICCYLVVGCAQVRPVVGVCLLFIIRLCICLCGFVYLFLLGEPFLCAAAVGVCLRSLPLHLAGGGVEATIMHWCVCCLHI